MLLVTQEDCLPQLVLFPNGIEVLAETFTPNLMVDVVEVVIVQSFVLCRESKKRC